MKLLPFSVFLRRWAGAWLLAAAALAGPSTGRAQSASAGLWVGTVTLDKVLDPQGALAPSGGAFQFRIIFHVNTDGVVRLLRDVIVMQRDADGNPSTAPEIALVTDLTQLPRYTGVVRRTDGRSTGLRFAAAAYDFPGTELAVAGKIEPENTLDFTLDVSDTAPTNPFRHKYHPDHEKGVVFQRVVTVSFKGGTAADTATGTRRLTGTYKETFRKLLATDVQAAGTIMLDRVSTAGKLNP